MTQVAGTGAGQGALGAGDRGAYEYIPVYTGNPYDSQDFVYRWRQYVRLYETSWEARKIVRIVPEDALRKDWSVEGISDEFADKISNRLQRLQFHTVLKRSLMLERLLGGCLTFMGLESDEDDPSKTYHPKKEASRLAFCNAIPVSRISRVTWDTDPLSEGYMRPDQFLINGNPVHTSRCLVWDGEPLFDPYDFALTNFRSNLAGFGPSKLAPLWDDIIKAVGTRQAAYQLIKTNNAMLVAVNALQDLSGTKSGQESLKKLKEIANNLNTYRAALIDGDQVEVSQHSASFGSVPELILTFIQILSAASDIPATRFLGQAPGGLNATGDSDLENYYNVIDAYQRQRIEPQLRRIYDVIGYNLDANAWHRERDELHFEFPPLWNASELEEAQKDSQNIDNVLKLYEQNLIGEDKVIEELNNKRVLSVDLDEDDISLVGEAGGSQGDEVMDDNFDPAAAIEQLKNSVQVPANAPNGEIDFARMIRAVGVDSAKIDMDQFRKGFKEEQEHADTVGGDELIVTRIVLDHLAEDAKYYDKLLSVMKNKVWNKTEAGLAQTIGADRVEVKKGGDKRYGIVFHYENGSVEFPERFRKMADARDPKVWFPAYIKNGRDILYKPYPKQGEVQHLRICGLDVAIENPKGSLRSSKNPDNPWTSILPADYGYVKGTQGADGDEIDIYIGEAPSADKVYIVDQRDLDTGGFDEHKCIFGCLSVAQARELYLEGFGDGRGEDRMMSITPVVLAEFKRWLKEGDTTKPYGGA